MKCNEQPTKPWSSKARIKTIFSNNEDKNNFLKNFKLRYLYDHFLLIVFL